MKKREGNGLRWGLSCFTGIIFAMMVMILPAMADDCGVVNETHPLTGYFGDNSAAPYTESQTYNVVTDSKGLMWESLGASQMMDWSSACYRCEQLTLAGRTDWRLPTVEELEHIVNDQMTPTTINSEFTAQAGPYWTKSVPSGFETNAFMVSFSDGQSAIADKTTPLYIRCVSDASSSSRETLKVSLKAATVVANDPDTPTAAFPATESDINAKQLQDDLIHGAPDLNSPAKILEAGQGVVGTLPLIPQKSELANNEGLIIFEVTAVKKDGSAAALPDDDIMPVEKLDYMWSVSDKTVEASMINFDKSKGTGDTVASDAGNHSIRGIFNDTTLKGTRETTLSGTYTVTVEVWDHENPRNYGKASVTITICNGNCIVNNEQCEFQMSPIFVSEDISIKFKSLFYQDKATDPKVKLDMPDLVMKLVPDPVGNRILFALEVDDEIDPKDKDKDGYTTDGSNGKGIDCDDNNTLINPGAEEIYGNRIDEDCFHTYLD